MNLSGREGRRKPDAGFRSQLQLGDRRYHVRDVHPQVTNALLHLGLARRAARRREVRGARREYSRSLRCWRRANEDQPGRWRQEVLLVAEEYETFSAVSPASAAHSPSA